MTRTLLASVAVLAFMLLRPCIADESYQSVQALYDLCKSRDTSSAKYGVCVGYIAGVGDMMQALGAVKGQSEKFPFAICAKPSYGAMVQAYLNWAEANPLRWDEGRLFGVMFALGTNWPCTQ